MNTSLKLASALAGGLFGFLSAPVSGHHSMAEYERGAVTEFEGVVLKESWRNPHILLEVATTGANGEEAIWYLEGGAVSAQRRRGVSGGLIHVGDRVRVAGAASTRRPNHMLVDHILLPDGVEMLVGSSREPRWSQTSIGSESGVIEDPNAAAAEARGIFRVWSQGTPAWYFPGRAAYQLTESAARAQAQWDDIEDNPLLQCTPPGMPSLIGNPYPMEFTERDDGIELRFEEFDAVRTIHMRGFQDPETVPVSPLGYSIGHWESDTLVVSTTRINWPYFNRVGAPQSEAVAIEERITAVDGGNRLDYVMTVTDPATLVEAFVWKAYWTWRPGERVRRYNCTIEER